MISIVFAVEPPGEAVAFLGRVAPRLADAEIALEFTVRDGSSQQNVVRSYDS